MTATASENDGAFQEVFFLGITKKSGSEIQFAGTIEDITPTDGEKQGESIVLGNGGRKWKRTPEGDYEVTCKIYPLDIKNTSGNDMLQYFLGGTYDVTGIVSQANSRGRDLFQLVFLLTDDTTVTAASGVTMTAYASRRTTFKDARCVSYKDSFGDKILTAEVVFKGPPFNSSGTTLITHESCTSSDSSGLPAITAYT
jgi:hypothetical protein